MNKDQLFDAVMKAIDQGYDVEIKKNKNGALVVLKIKKEIISRCE